MPKTALLLSAMLLAAPAVAQDVPTERPPEDRNSLSIGAGAIVTPSYEGSDSSTVFPQFVISGTVSGFTFYSRGTTFFFDVIRDGSNESGWDLGVGPAANLRIDRTTKIKDAQVRALGKLDTAVEVGGYVSITKRGVVTSPFDVFTARVAYMKDVADAHDSYVIQPSIEYGTPLSRKAYVGVIGLAEYVGGKYGNYYFDVTPAGSAASGLPVYTAAGKGWKRAGAALVVSHSITGDLVKGLSVFGIGGYYRMLGEYKRSPIVSVAGDADQWVGGVGLAYSF